MSSILQKHRATAVKFGKIPAVHKLLRSNHDAFEPSYVSGPLQYGKPKDKKGKEYKLKPCFVMLTTVSIYILKEGTYETVRRFLISTCSLTVDASNRLHLRNMDGETTITGPAAALQEVNAVLQAIRERADQPLGRTSSSRRPSHIEAFLSDGEDDGSERGSPLKLKAGWASGGDGGAAEDSGHRLFLVKNIVSADFLDYSALRSIYPTTSQTDGKESQALIRALTDFVSQQEEAINRVCSQNAQEFVHAVRNNHSRNTAALKQELGHISDMMLESSSDLKKAGMAVLQARKERANIKTALTQIKLCHAVAVLHTKAEQLASERKYYPALLAVEELENKVRPLLSHAYGRWVFRDAVPGLRKQIRSSVQHDFNGWLTCARAQALVFGRRAFEWAAQEMQLQCGTDQRKVDLLEEDDDYLCSPTSEHHRRTRQHSVVTVDSSCPSVEGNPDEDWADDLLWDVQGIEPPAGDVMGAAQFVETLTDILINPESASPFDTPPPSPTGSVRGDRGDRGDQTLNTNGQQGLRIVHTCVRVFEELERGGGASLRKYYAMNRARQLRLKLQSATSLKKVREKGCEWLAEVTGFFLVDSVVQQSTFPPLCDDADIQGWWEEAVKVIEKWMELASAEINDWEELLDFQSKHQQAAVALEEVWAVAGDSPHRLSPMLDGIAKLRMATLQQLHIYAKTEIDNIVGSEKYQGIVKHDELHSKLFLHLGSAGGPPPSLPRCTSTVPRVADVLLRALDGAFAVHRLSGDADDEVRSHIDSLLIHLASRLEEQVGKLSRIHTMQICILSVNAAAYDCVGLALAQRFAQRASSLHVVDGRLQVFQSSRKLLRRCQRRAEEDASRLLRTQLKEYMNPLTAKTWFFNVATTSGDYTPLSDLRQYFESNWTKRSFLLPAVLGRKMQKTELAELDARLCALAQDIVLGGSQHSCHGSRAAALKRFANDVQQLSTFLRQKGLGLGKFPSMVAELEQQATALDSQPAPPSPSPSTQVDDPKASAAKKRFTFGWRKSTPSPAPSAEPHSPLGSDEV